MNSAKTKLAVFALVLGAISLLNLLGLEKSIAAIVLGIVALKELSADADRKTRVYAYAGIALGAVQICALIAMIIWKGPEFLQMLKK